MCQRPGRLHAPARCCSPGALHAMAARIKLLHGSTASRWCGARCARRPVPSIRSWLVLGPAPTRCGRAGRPAACADAARRSRRHQVTVEPGCAPLAGPVEAIVIILAYHPARRGRPALAARAGTRFARGGAVEPVFAGRRGNPLINRCGTARAILEGGPRWARAATSRRTRPRASRRSAERPFRVDIRNGRRPRAAGRTRPARALPGRSETGPSGRGPVARNSKRRGLSRRSLSSTISAPERRRSVVARLNASTSWSCTSQRGTFALSTGSRHRAQALAVDHAHHPPSSRSSRFMNAVMPRAPRRRATRGGPICPFTAHSPRRSRTTSGPMPCAVRQRLVGLQNCSI